jgi:purine-nucleoside phosphorylase
LRSSGGDVKCRLLDKAAERLDPDMTIPLYDRALEAARFISLKAGTRKPQAGVVLGSGLAEAVRLAGDPVEVPFGEIPYLVSPTVEGHPGRLIIGSLGATDVVVMKGRFHFYEGYSMEDVTLPVRALCLMGIKTLVLTNAAGGISPHLNPGSLMLITDHINMMGENPLRGPNESRFGPRFPDMTAAYAPEYIDLAHDVARSVGLPLAEGVYMALGGPTYETPAEVRMLRDLGADAVGMSTVPEVIVARHCGMKVLAISCITNIAAGLTHKEINHQQVMEIGRQSGAKLSALLEGLLARLVASDAEISS